MTKTVLKKLLTERGQVIDKLTRELKEKDSKITRLEEFITREDGTPEDCKRGTWCGACEFSRSYHIGHGYDRRVFYFCDKGNACPNFVEKK